MGDWHVLDLGDSLEWDHDRMSDRAPPTRGVCGLGRLALPPGFFTMLSICALIDECPGCNGIRAAWKTCAHANDDSAPASCDGRGSIRPAA
ncbi:hypothetical protein BH09MYX1_BH09MYX1_05570 [soil metagenome]